MTVNEGMFTSNSDDWSTPQDLYDKLDGEFHFTLDPCASTENHKTEKYFTEADDGLKQEWHGSVFCNPPYSNIKNWVKKAYEEAQKPYCTRVVMLIPARPDTKYWHEYVQFGTDIRFLKGRLKFGAATNSAPFPSAVVVFTNVVDDDNDFFEYMRPNRIKFWDWRSNA